MPRRARSLRFKITLWFLLVFFAVQVALVIAFSLLRRDVLRRSFDGQIADAAQAMVENILITEPDWTAEALPALIPADADFVLAAVRDAAGRCRASWKLLAPQALPFSHWEKVPAGPLGPVFTRLAPDQAAELTGLRLPLRLITLPFRFGDQEEILFFQAAVPEALLRRDLGPFSDLLLLGIPAGLLAALAAAWLIAGRVVRPIRRLQEAAQAVSPDRLGDRIEVRTSHSEISGLQEELNRALERLEAGYKAQEHFISNVSHELQTPIAVLLAQSQNLLEGNPEPEAYRQFACSARDETRRLARLVESFLTIARADLSKGSLRADEIAVHDLVLDAVQHCALLAEQGAVLLQPRFPSSNDDEEIAAVSGDGELLRAMLENLLRNAIRFAPPGSPVEIAAEAGGDQVCLTVRDRGPGIPAGYLDRVFDRFVQAPQGGRGSGGSGLGLSIARSIAQLHGGSISASNQPDGGCAFQVRLPKRRPTAGDQS